MPTRHWLTKLRNLDFFAATPSIKVDSRTRFFSWLGLLTTLALIAGLTTLSVIFFVQLAERDNPRVVQSTQYGVHEEPIRLGFDDNTLYIRFALRMQEKPYDFYVNDSIYRVYAHIYYNNGTQYQELPIDTCLDDTRLRCVDVNKLPPDTVPLKSDALPNDTYLFIGFVPCDPEEPGSNCAPPEVINDTISKSAGIITYSNWAIDPLNYSHPFMRSSRFHRVYINAHTHKVMELLSTQVQFTSDNGWLLESKTTQMVINTDLYYIDSRQRMYTDSEILSLQLKNTGDLVIYKRSYPKVQDTLAQINGLGNTFILIATFLMLLIPLAKNRMHKRLVHDYYDISAPKARCYVFTENDVKLGDNEEGEVVKKRVPDDVLTLDDLDAQMPKVKRSKDAKKEERRVVMKKRIEAFVNEDRQGIQNKDIIEIETQSLPERVSSCSQTQVQVRQSQNRDATKRPRLRSLFKPKPETILVRRGAERLSKQFDLLNIAKNTLEINKLKACLLSNEQRILFENSPKPRLYIDLDADPRSDGYIKSYDWSGEDYISKEKLKEAFVAIKESSKKSKVDQRLLALYEK